MKPTALNGGHTKLPVVGYKGASSTLIIQFKLLQNVGVQREGERERGREGERERGRGEST